MSVSSIPVSGRLCRVSYRPEALGHYYGDKRIHGCVFLHGEPGTWFHVGPQWPGEAPGRKTNNRAYLIYDEFEAVNGSNKKEAIRQISERVSLTERRSV